MNVTRRSLLASLLGLPALAVKPPAVAEKPKTVTVYTVQNTAAIGRPVDRVIDATGRVFSERLLECHVETGYIRRLGEQPTVVNYHQWYQAEEIIWAAAPLTVVFYERTTPWQS